MPPRIFFSDPVSGTNNGGQDNKGAFVTIYGKGFEATRDGSSVTVSGGAADNYPIWTDTKVMFQLGPGVRTGKIEVHLSHGSVSNGVLFVVARPRGAAFDLGACQFVNQVSRQQSQPKNELGSREGSVPEDAVASVSDTWGGLRRNRR